MIRLLRYLLLGLMAVVLVTIAMANRGVVTVRLMPADFGAMLGLDGQAEVPLFVVIFGGIVAGILIGFVWEWFREHKYRASASARAREVARLERELAGHRETGAVPPEDDVLAILDRRKAG
jgi:lipopolysaccharide assembly protein A